MAQHIKICNLDYNQNFPIENMGMWCNNAIHNAVGKSMQWLHKKIINDRNLDTRKDWHEYKIGRRKIRLLPKIYRMMNEDPDNIVIDMGELRWVKKLQAMVKPPLKCIITR